MASTYNNNIKNKGEYIMKKEMRELLLTTKKNLEEVMKKLEYDRQLYENFSMSEYDDAEEEKISNRIIILDKALEEINKELRGK